MGIPNKTNVVHVRLFALQNKWNHHKIVMVIIVCVNVWYCNIFILDLCFPACLSMLSHVIKLLLCKTSILEIASLIGGQIEIVLLA